MHAGAITSEKVFTIDNDVCCRECGYNLRGLASAGECPECGHPISLSITDSMDNFLRSLPDEARRHLRIEVTFEPYGLWITGLPLLAGLALIVLGIFIGTQYGPMGGFLGAGAGVVIAGLATSRLASLRERRAIAHYLGRQCIDRRLSRCPLCYHDLSGDLADTCPECGCPVCVRQLT